jgi:hypothetical protein
MVVVEQRKVVVVAQAREKSGLQHKYAGSSGAVEIERIVYKNNEPSETRNDSAR